MPKKKVEAVERICGNPKCPRPSGLYKTKVARSRYCSAACRAVVWNQDHRVRSKEDVGREFMRAYWREQWHKRKGRKEAAQDV